MKGFQVLLLRKKKEYTINKMFKRKGQGMNNQIHCMGTSIKLTSGAEMSWLIEAGKGSGKMGGKRAAGGGK